MNTESVYNNMFLHYDAIIKEDCQCFGADDISESIFNKLDGDSNGYLDKQECIDSKHLLGDILRNAINEFSDLAEKYFGESYSKQLGKYNDANQDSLNEDASVKVLKQNIEEAKIKIKEYASLHPDNEKINLIAKALDSIDFQIVNECTGYEAITYTGINLIKFNAQVLENINPVELMKNLIHEMGHYINGDEFSSVAEEVDVESFAIDMAEDIENMKLHENKDEYLTEFANRYRWGISSSNYGLEASPGYNGLPLNAGFVINDKILSSETIGNQTIIQVSGNKTYYITWSEEKDEDGNPYPESVILSWPWEDSEYEGLDKVNIIYKNYDKTRKVWKDVDWADRDKYDPK